MAVGSQAKSVTERIEEQGRLAAAQSFERTQQRFSQPPDLLTRWTRRINNSLRRQPIKWTLVGIGVGCIVGAAVIEA